MSTCLLLCHLEALWSFAREIQLAAAGPWCALLPFKTRAGRVHLPAVPGNHPDLSGATAASQLLDWTHFMYLQATKNPFYLHVGMDILQSLEKNAKVRCGLSAFLWQCTNTIEMCVSKCLVTCRCGYATLHHVVEKSKEDRMESFFLSETCKYLYLVRYTCHPRPQWTV